MSYRVVGQLFGIARSTVAGLVINVCLTMETELLSFVVHPGSPAQIRMCRGC